jgi:hypothetical protein
MATTITNATLTYQTTETVTLNGKVYGNSNTLTVANINEVDQRIVSIPTSLITLLAFGTAAAAGTFVRANVKFLRITNKDDTNFVMLKIVPTADTPVWFKLEAGKTFELHAMSIENNSSFSAFDTIDGISAQADTAAVDVEYFIALT